MAKEGIKMNPIILSPQHGSIGFKELGTIKLSQLIREKFEPDESFGKELHIKHLKNGDLLVHPATIKQARLILQSSSLGEVKFKAKDSISPTDLIQKRLAVKFPDATQQDIESNLRESGVSFHSVHKVGSKGTFVVSFSKDQVPLHIKILHQETALLNYGAKPIQCYKCRKFGHISKDCKSNIQHEICVTCSKDHPYNKECKQKPLCANCHGEHNIKDKSCPVFQAEKEVFDLRKNEDCSYLEARVMLKDKLKEAHGKALKRKLPDTTVSSKPQESVLIVSEVNFLNPPRTTPSLHHSLNDPELPLEFQDFFNVPKEWSDSHLGKFKSHAYQLLPIDSAWRLMKLFLMCFYDYDPLQKAKSRKTLNVAEITVAMASQLMSSNEVVPCLISCGTSLPTKEWQYPEFVNTSESLNEDVSLGEIRIETDFLKSIAGDDAAVSFYQSLTRPDPSSNCSKKTAIAVAAYLATVCLRVSVKRVACVEAYLNGDRFIRSLGKFYSKYQVSAVSPKYSVTPFLSKLATQFQPHLQICVNFYATCLDSYLIELVHTKGSGHLIEYCPRTKVIANAILGSTAGFGLSTITTMMRTRRSEFDTLISTESSEKESVIRVQHFRDKYNPDYSHLECHPNKTTNAFLWPWARILDCNYFSNLQPRSNSSYCAKLRAYLAEFVTPDENDSESDEITNKKSRFLNPKNLGPIVRKEALEWGKRKWSEIMERSKVIFEMNVALIEAGHPLEDLITSI